MTEIDEIKQKLDIIDVVGQYVPLKKSGKNYKGLCPFHGEKTPSFMVNQELQIYKCFGCNESGDIFTFVEKMEGYDFRQALESLAERANVKLKEYSRNESVEETKSVLFEINEVAKKFYHYILTRHKIGEEALKYLVEKRKLKQETIDSWELGYAPNSWTSLRDFMIKKGYKEKDLLRAGVIVPDKFESTNNDKFRGRVIFPLIGIDGKVLGFGGRTITNREPKYLNTQETSIFHKENYLFGLDKSRMEIENEGVVIVEGYMDAISAHQSGITNIVATCGTALTLPHLKIISRYTKDLILCFDSDSAGINATFRAIELCNTLDLNLKVAVLPQGIKDIDDLTQLGKNEAIKVIKGALPAYDFLIKRIESKHDINSPIGKKKIMEEVLYFLAKSPNPVIKEHYVQVLGDKIHVDPGSITKYMQDHSKLDTEGSLDSIININSAKSPQEYFLALLLSQESLDKYKKILQNLTPEDLSQSQISDIYDKLLTFIEIRKHLSVKSFLHGLSEQNLVKARELSLWDVGDISENEERFEKELEETIKRLKKDSLKKRMSMLTVKIREAERSGDEKEAIKLTKQFEKLKKFV